MTPREIVAELDKYVVGQGAAKRAVAIALSNRMRRQKLSPELAEDIMPKNIIMIGPTGVGKTEIARRLAKLTNSPFLKVEASKFTEVGYVGRDVESIVRDLVEIAIDMVREEKMEDVEDKAELNAEDRLLDLLLPPAPTQACGDAEEYGADRGDDDSDWNARDAGDAGEGAGGAVDEAVSATKTQTRHRERLAIRLTAAQTSHERTREKLRQQFREGRLDERMVEIDVRDRNQPSFEFLSTQGPEEMDMNLKDMLPGLFGQRTKKRKMKVAEAFEYLVQEEESRLIDMDQVTRLAVERVEDSGIVFLDEIDKIAGARPGMGRM
jgi:ATP-dependent HslUV protease ATP-binding subunit HslU